LRFIPSIPRFAGLRAGSEPRLLPHLKKVGLHAVESVTPRICHLTMGVRRDKKRSYDLNTPKMKTDNENPCKEVRPAFGHFLFRGKA